MFSFEFATANRIIFGAGKLNELGKQIESNTKRLLFVHGRSSEAIPRVRESLSELGIAVTEFEVHGEPTIAGVGEGVRAARGCDIVIGLGGGTVLDTGKAIAGPLGGMLHAPHGALCARFLPLVMEANIKAMESRQPEHPSLGRYVEIARILTGEQEATADDGVKWTGELVNDLKIPRLSAYGMEPEDFALRETVQKTQKANSFKGNPIVLSETELIEILEKAP